MIYYKILRRLALVLCYFACFLFFLEFTLMVLGCFFSRKAIWGNRGADKSFNIICIGDSVTYGWGVDTHLTYPKQLEQMLDKNNPNRKFQVFNLGVPGSNSSQHLRRLEEVLSNYKPPEVIVVLTGANDCWNLGESNIFNFINTKSGILSPLNIKTKSFFYNLRICKMLKIISLNLKGRPPESKIDCFKIIQSYENIDAQILKRLLEYNLSQIAFLARSRGIKVILLNYPTGDLYGDNIVQKVAGRFDIPFIDMCSIFNSKLEYLDYADLFLYDNTHPNAEGCRIMADELYKSVIGYVK